MIAYFLHLLTNRIKMFKIYRLPMETIDGLSPKCHVLLLIVRRVEAAALAGKCLKLKRRVIKREQALTPVSLF